MTRDEIIIREYCSGDELQINAFYNAEYHKNRKEHEWKWEFKQNPQGDSILVVAEHKGKIIGTQALLPVSFYYEGKEINSAKSEATLLAEEYRGKGLFNKLYNKVFELALSRNISLIWGFTSAEKPFKKCGFTIPGNINELLLVLNPWQAYRHLKSKTYLLNPRRIFTYELCLSLIIRVFVFYNFIKVRLIRLFPLYQTSSSEIEILPLTKTNKQLNVFWNEFKKNAQFFTINRTSKYLEWRIFNNPYIKHCFLVAMKNEKIYGYIILSQDNSGKVGYINDFCVLGNKFKEVSNLLIKQSIKYFSNTRVGIIRSWSVVNNQEARKYLFCLKRYGFSLIKKGTPIVIKILDDKIVSTREILNVHNWFITRIFSEGVKN